MSKRRSGGWAAVALAASVVAAVGSCAREARTQSEHPHAHYPDGRVSVNVRCPVKGSNVDPRFVPVTVNGEPVGFCCIHCAEAFVRTPDQFLPSLSLDLRDPVDPQRAAVVDSTHWVRVNHELYFFADSASRAEFEADPIPWCGKLTDPVSGARFRPTPRSPSADYEGRVYYFAGEPTHVTFLSAPKRFAERVGEVFPPAH